MKKQNFGSSLFHRNFVLSKYVEELPADAAAAAHRLLKERPALDPPNLRNLLAGAFNLTPLTIGRFQSRTVEVEERRYLNDYDTWQHGYLHTALVFYSGSGELWKQKLHHGFEFPFLGMIGIRSIKLQIMSDNKDGDWFERHVQANLAKLRHALSDFSPAVVTFNEMVSAILDRCAANQQYRS